MTRQVTSDWFTKYIEYTSGQESPECYHRWVAMSLILSTLERNVWFNKGYYTLFPNEYIVLIATSARCRKSVAMGIGMDILNAADHEKFDVFAQKATPEALIGRLCKLDKAASLLYASELVTFLGKDAMGNGLITILTDLYDGSLGKGGRPWTYETRSRGREELTEICINMLGGATTDSIKVPIPREAVGGGFTSRIIFVFADQPREPRAYPEITEDEKQARLLLIHDLKEVRKLSGEYTMTPEMREASTTWYESLVDPQDDVLSGYYGRKQDHCLKLCMGFAAAHRDDLVIELTDFELARAMLEGVEKDLPAVVYSIGATPGGVDTQEIWRIIRKLHKVPRNALFRALYMKMSADAIDGALDVLTQARMIEFDGEVYTVMK